jgi:hypothetical protein
MKPSPTIIEVAAAIEHARQGAYPGREAVAINEAWRALHALLQPVTRPQLHLVRVLAPLGQ